jgi:glycosyltransferase involved in cell wall biosynthesis
VTTAAPALTVAIPTFNGSAHLAETLAGILAQRGAAFDLLACDDRSDDDTVALVRDRAGDRARIEVNSERLGLAGNWNRCVALARTPWVAVFHQDDLMRPGDLARRLDALARPGGDGLGLLAEPADAVDGSGRIVPPSTVGHGGIDDHGPSGVVDFAPGAFSDRLATSNVLRCSAVTTNRRAHEALGGFDPAWRYVVDWEFWLRAADRFGVRWIVGEPLVSVRWHAASETHRFKQGLDDLEESARLVTLRGGRPGRLLARAYLNRAHEALRAGRVELARTSLGRAFRVSPTAVAAALADPRLAVQMGLLAVAPGLAQRWLARRV